MPTQILIDVVSDVICPWCYLGAKRIERGIELMKERRREGRVKPVSASDDIQFVVRWRPWQLNPNMSESGVSKRESYLYKFKGNEQRLNLMVSDMQRMGEKEEGRNISFNFSEEAVLANSFRAHCLLEVVRSLAMEGGTNASNFPDVDIQRFYFQVQHQLSLALFDALHSKGGNIAQRNVLLECIESIHGVANTHTSDDSSEKMLLEQVGTSLKQWVTEHAEMSLDDVRTKTEAGIQVQKQIDTARTDLEVMGVPHFFFTVLVPVSQHQSQKCAARFAIPGAQDGEYYATMLERMLQKAPEMADINDDGKSKL